MSSISGHNKIMKQIPYKEAVYFLLPKHYSGVMPSISIAYGWYIEYELVAVCTFGCPAAPNLYKGLGGEKYSNSVYELNRLCRIDTLKLQLSQFVAYCLRDLSKRDWIIVSFSDTAMNHNGYIYQACNFIYTGKTRKRYYRFAEPKKSNFFKICQYRHSRDRHKIDPVLNKRQVASVKHRYIYFCTNNKRLKKEWKKNMNYDILPYPKEKNKNYKLGTIIKPEIVDYNE